MALQLDHTLVPARDKDAAARFISRVFGVPYIGLWRGFAVVRINNVLSLDFTDDSDFKRQHYAFLASDHEFDVIVDRLKDDGRDFGSGRRLDDGEINYLHSGRGVYFVCDDGHIWEVLTHTYILDQDP